MDSVSGLDWPALDWLPLDWVGANPVVAAVLIILLALVVLVFGAIFGPFGRGRGRGQGGSRMREHGGATVRRRSDARRAEPPGEVSAAAGSGEDFDTAALAEHLLTGHRRRAATGIPADMLVAQEAELRKAVKTLRDWARRGADSDRAALALRQFAGGRTEAAEAIFREALAQGRDAEFEGRLAAAAAARHLGALCVLHDAEAAREAYEEAVVLDPQHFDGLTNLGEIYNHLGRPEDSERIFTQQLRIDEVPPGAGLQRVTAFTNLARSAHLRGDLDRAIGFCERAVDLSRDIGQYGHVAYNLGNLGILHYERGDYDLAEELLRQALALEDSSGNEPAKAIAMSYLGFIHKARGELEAAQKTFEEALELSREIGDQEGVGLHLLSLAELAESRGEPAEAAALCRQCLTLAEDHGLRERAADAQGGLGDLAKTGGDLAAARMRWTAARALYEELGITEEIGALDTKLAELGRP